MPALKTKQVRHFFAEFSVRTTPLKGNGPDKLVCFPFGPSGVLRNASFPLKKCPERKNLNSSASQVTKCFVWNSGSSSAKEGRSLGDFGGRKKIRWVTTALQINI